MSAERLFNIVTWNINGLRSFGGPTKWRKIFDEFNADILCFQETKIPKSSIEEWMVFIPDYTSYFSFPSGQLQNSGYSGVASYCRESIRPIACDASFFVTRNEVFGDMPFDEDDENIHYAKRWPEMVTQHDYLPVQSPVAKLWQLADSEGRCLVTKHQFSDSPLKEQDKFVYIFNLYCPRNDTERIERQHYQLRFYYMLEKRVMQLMNQSPNNHIIILGDFNTTCGPNDVYDDTKWCYEGSHGRKWLQDLLNKKHSESGECLFIDAFRHLHPEEKRSFTCWNTQLGCRITNFGSRLDYIVIDHKLLPYLHDCFHANDVFGSDHCPVVIQFKNTFNPKCTASGYSSVCSKSWPEFNSGSSQSSIKRFFTKRPLDSVPKETFKAKSRKPAGPTQTSMQQFIKTFKKIENTTLNNVEKQQPQEFGNKPLPELHESSKSESQEQNARKESSQSAWKAIFKQPEVPKCFGHNMPCVRRKSKKPGLNLGKEFFSCPKAAMEPKGHPETNCGFFRWISK